MQIIQYVRQLIPWLKKDDVLEDIRITLGEFNQTVIPSVKGYVKTLDTYRFKSEEVTKITDLIKRNLKIRLSGNKSIVSLLDDLLPLVVDNLNEIEREAESVLERDSINTALTAKKIILIRAADQFGFISHYTASLLDYIYAKEFRSLARDDAEEIARFSPNKERYILTRAVTYASLLSIYSQPAKDFKSKLDLVPDIIVDEKSGSATGAVYNEDKIDPFNVGQSSHFARPIFYRVGLAIASYQANRYKEMKDTKKMLDLRLMLLDSLKSGEQNPNVEKEIAYIKKRVEGIQIKMREMEESAA